jgi:hypothetical protein
MKTEITGETLPVFEIGLEAGDKIVAEPGEFGLGLVAFAAKPGSPVPFSTASSGTTVSA